MTFRSFLVYAAVTALLIAISVACTADFVNRRRVDDTVSNVHDTLTARGRNLE